jgi:hypothetical protein
MELKKYNTKERKVKDYQMEKYMIATPDGTDEVVHKCDIVIPKNFRRTNIHIEKIKNVIKYYVSNGTFDKPITVVPMTNEKGFHNKYLLVDGYSRYYAANEYMGIDYVPIKYVSIDTYCNKRNM